MDEFKLYEEIKKAFTVEKGKVLFIELTSDKIADLVPELLDNDDDLACRVSSYTVQKRYFAVFDYLTQDDPIYRFYGKIFMKKEVISTGEVYDFATYSQEPITAEDIRKDFARLSFILRDPKAS